MNFSLGFNLILYILSSEQPRAQMGRNETEQQGSSPWRVSPFSRPKHRCLSWYIVTSSSRLHIRDTTLAVD